MNFKTERLTVRPFCDGDREKMLEMLYDESIKKTYMIPDFENVGEAEKLFRAFMRLSLDGSRFVGAICLGSEIIGFLNDTEISGNTVEMGYVISPKHQNNGFCTEAMRGAIKYLFENGFSEVICGAFEENAASKRVMQKCGMEMIPKTDAIEYKGKKHNCVYYSVKKLDSIFKEKNMIFKKQRGQKRKLKALLNSINQIKPFQNTDCQYEHFHIPCDWFISSPKTSSKIKTSVAKAWLDKTAELIKQKPSTKSFCKIVAAIDEMDLWNSQIIVFYDENYYNSFWLRESTEQIWVPIVEPDISFIKNRHIESSLKEKGYCETMTDFDITHKTRLWFYGDVN